MGKIRKWKMEMGNIWKWESGKWKHLKMGHVGNANHFSLFFHFQMFPISHFPFRNLSNFPILGSFENLRAGTIIKKYSAYTTYRQRKYSHSSESRREIKTFTGSQSGCPLRQLRNGLGRMGNVVGPSPTFGIFSANVRMCK